MGLVMNGNNYITPVIHVVEGQKIWMPNEKRCYEMEEKLNKLGIETRTNCTCGTNLWSVYIVSIPDKLNGMYCEL